ncbi:MAG: response regulator [Pseudomonadota bacterium]
MGNKVKILCVEDEVDIRENLAGILESEGFEVLQAEDGKQGLEIFLEQRPDIIISDIMMPQATGHDLLKAIRENKEIDNSNVPFILLSALGQKEDILRGINLEASDYLVKPVDFDLLIAKVREKTANLKKTAEVASKNINNLKSQVSNVVPYEMLQYVDMINHISSALRSEIYGPLPHKKYLEDINKIYINSLKLKTIVNNFLTGSAISNQLDVHDEILQPLQVIQDFITGLNKKFQSQITIDDIDSASLPNIKINKRILNEVIKKLVGCMFKINDEMQIKVAISNDHMDRLALIFYPQIKISKDILESQVDKSSLVPMLDSQGLNLEVVDSNNSTSAVLLVPNYRVIQKH